MDPLFEVLLDISMPCNGNKSWYLQYGCQNIAPSYKKWGKFPQKITKIPSKTQFSVFSALSWPYQEGIFYFLTKNINSHPPPTCIYII